MLAKLDGMLLLLKAVFIASLLYLKAERRYQLVVLHTCPMCRVKFIAQILMYLCSSRAQDDESDTEEDYVNRRNIIASSPPLKRMRVIDNGPSLSNSNHEHLIDEDMDMMGQGEESKMEEFEQV